MIKKLRTRFILMCMTALLLVLTSIIASINVMNYHSIIHNADELLIILSDNHGRFPRPEKPKEAPFPPDMSPEIPYETRFFSVLFSDSGTVIHAETGNIAAIDTENAITLAQKAASSKNLNGFIGNYRYQKYSDDIGTRIIFLDCGRKLDSFYSFLFASCLISLVGYLIVFLLITFFSSHIIRPITESYEKQKQFITDAGHEIKTPLTIINADIDVLEMEIGANEWLQDIQKQTERLSALTRDLVYLSRMEEADNSMPMIDFPLSDIVNETASSFQALAQTQNKTFTCNVQPMLSLYGNEKAIRQLVTILLDNALKYSPPDGIITLMLERRNRSIRLTVFNTTDYTIPKESLHLLFERFYRTDSSHNSQTGGYGIGLSVAKAIVTSHNGKIQASSQDGQSLLLTVSFPV